MVFFLIGIYFLELYKHFVKPGYKKINKKLIVFDDEDGIFVFFSLFLAKSEEKQEEKEKKEKKKEKKEKKEKN